MENKEAIELFIKAIKDEFKDQNWEYLEFIKDRVLENVSVTSPSLNEKVLEYALAEAKLQRASMFKEKGYVGEFTEKIIEDGLLRMFNYGYKFQSLSVGEEAVEFLKWTAKNNWAYNCANDNWDNLGKFNIDPKKEEELYQEFKTRPAK